MVGAARDVPAGTRYDVEIVDFGERIPGTLLVPNTGIPAPAALMLHGWGSSKERMVNTLGEALVKREIVALGVDLPLHGERSVSPSDLAGANPIRLLAAWRDAVREARLALEYLAAHPAVDAQRLGLVGYSLGSFVANIVAADAPTVQALVLAASGDLPEGLPFESLVRSLIDPLRAVRRVEGRPLLMVNGRFDRTVKPSQAERLFAQAAEPKTMRWYGGGHWPPPREIDYAADWLSKQLKAARPSRPARPPRSASHTPRTRASSGE